MPNQGTTAKRNKAASATNFVKVVRALIRSCPPNATSSPPTAVAVPVPAFEAGEEGFKEAATHQKRTSREPRTALDVSGHCFAKNLQVEIGRTRNRVHRPVLADLAGSDDATSLPDTVTWRQQQDHHHQYQQSIFFGVSEGGRGLLSSPRKWLNDEDARRRGHADGEKSSPRSSRASSTTSTLPPSPDAAGTAAVARPRSELPPLVPKTTSSRCTAAGTCRRQQQQASRAAYFA